MADQIGVVLNGLSDPAQDPAIAAENQTILGLHAAFETLADATALVGSIHGLTNAGETIGLGRVGGNNVVTDIAQAPGDVVNGASPATEMSNLLIDTGDAVTAGGGMLEGAGTDMSNPDLKQEAAFGLAQSTLGTDLSDGSEPLVSASVGGDQPITLAAGSGQTIANVDALSGSGNHLITGDAGASGGPTFADAGLLTIPDATSPIGAEIGDGTNVANANLLPNSHLMQTFAPTFQGINGPDNGDHIATGAAGVPGSAPIADTGLLTSPDSQSPIGAEVANGNNLAGLDTLSGAAGHIVTGDAGAPNGSTLSDTGLLTNPDSTAPVGAEVGDGQNVADASLLGENNLLGDTTPLLQNVNGNDDGEHIATGAAGVPGSAPIADTGLLTSPDSQSPIGAEVANGNNLAGLDTLSGAAGHIVTGDAGAPNGSTLSDTGLLTNPDSTAPVGAEVGDGQNVADASLLGENNLLGDTAPLLQNVNGNDDGEHVVTGDAGSTSAAPILDTGVLTTPDSQSPVGAEAANGDNVAAVDALSQTAGHIASAGIGEANGSPTTDAGVLTEPNGQTPVSAEVANGQNLADASLLSHSDVLSFPNLQGTGTDALTGTLPAGIDLGSVVSDGSTSSPGDQSLMEANTDGGPLVQIHDMPTSTVGLNDHPIV